MVLLKPGKLTVGEFRAMQEHVKIGAEILAEGRFAVLRLARVIALAHHECWDGTGYPHGRAGTAIPLAGRIAAIADVFDALAHERPYKRAWSLADAVIEIERLAGESFDPRVVDAFAALDHPRLLEPIEAYDLHLRPTPLAGKSAENGAGAVIELSRTDDAASQGLSAVHA